jgi:hypothetical protein
VPATLTVDISSAKVDLREQVLIALFGDGALNSEAGGKRTMVFSQEDYDAFSLLNTDTVSLLELSQKCSEEMVSAIQKYASDAQKYANTNPATTGTDKRKITDTVMSALVDQVTPSVINGSAIMVTLASDIGDHSKGENIRFFSQKGRSSEIVTACYNQFACWENRSRLFDDFKTQNLAKAHHLPLVDVFPWFKKDSKDFNTACQLLRQYLTATTPLVVLTYGTHVR